MENLRDKFERNKKWLFYALVAVFLWGIVAHGYCFLSSNFSHDSLSEFNGADGSNVWKIRLGRFVVPLYKAVFRTDLTLPWIAGLLSLVWIGLAVFLVIRMFRVESRNLIFLIAGIFTVNITVSATAATYMHDYDGDMFAMLCAVIAVYFWKNVRWGSVVGAAFVAMALGIYQSYISVTIVLVMFVCIFELLDGANFKNILIKGLKAVGMLILGGILYYIVLQIVLAATGLTLSSGDYNSLDKALELTPRYAVSLVIQAYVDCIRRLLNVISPYPAALVRGATFVMAVAAAGILVAGLRSKCMGCLEKLLCIVLIVLLPLGMNITFVLTMGIVHDLMVYAVWLFYLFVLLLADWAVKKFALRKPGRYLQPACMLLVLLLMYGNVQTANAIYLKKDMEQEAYLSLMTRVLYRMEEVEGYEPGVTPVVFVGTLDQLNDVISGFEDYRGITGISQSAVAGTQEDYRVRTYFQYVLGNPANIAGNPTWSQMQADPTVAQMPCYPEEGSVALVDGVLIVKLGE